MNKTIAPSTISALPKNSSLEVPTEFRAALISLNEIGVAINRLTPQGHAGLAAALQLIVDSATRMIVDSAAKIYIFDAVAQDFDPTLRVATHGFPDSSEDGAPRPDGFGIRAIQRRRPFFSYEEPDLGVRSPFGNGTSTVMGCFPLIVANQPLGALYVYLRGFRHFGQFELLIIDNLVNHAAMAIYQAERLAHIQRDLLHQEQALNRLWRAGMLISSRLGLEETLEAILDMALGVTGAHYGIFRLVDEAGANLVTRAIGGVSGRPQIGALPIDGNSIMGWVAAHRQPLCIHDLEAAPWVRLYYPLDADLRMRSELAVPLVGASGRLEGVLNLESPSIGAFGDQDRYLLQSLATQAVIAIQEARLLDALLEVAHLLLVKPCQEVLQHLVTQAKNLLDAAASTIWTLDGGDLIPQAASASLSRDRLPLYNSLTGQAVLERRAVVCEDVREDPRFHSVALARSQSWSQALIVPLMSSEGREALGAFSVYGLQGESVRFTDSEWDRKVLTCLAYYAALALQNAQRQRALRLAEERHSVAETFAAVGDVAGNVLHHLNNKVGTIPARVQAIQDKCGVTLSENDYLASNLIEIEHSAREAMDAVHDSLAYLRPIHAAPVTIVECVSTALAAVALPPDVQVEIIGVDDLPPVVASQRSLVFVFTNLFDNASAAMQGVGTIRVSGTLFIDRVSTLGAVAPSRWVEVAVADDGPGIVPEDQTQIFEFGFSDRNERHGKRLGFGLWWVKTLLMRLGGSVTVDSDGLEGTTFVLRLPCVEVQGG